MLDSHLNSDRPARRTALIAQELGRYDIDIAALSETRLSDEGSLTEDQSGFTFYWKGYPPHERRLHGVGFAVRNSLVPLMEDSPVGVSARIMRLRIPLTRDRHATLFSCYAPTLDSPHEVKEEFYEQLQGELQNTPISDKLLILGDFNARVGSSHLSWAGVIGRHGVGKANSNGHRLLSLCSQNHLIITNTLFTLKDIHKGTWMHPRSKQWHMLDYVIVRQSDRRDVQITRAMRGAECWTDHRLVRSCLALRIRPPIRKKAARKKLNCATLRTEKAKEDLAAAISHQLADAPPLDVLAVNVEDSWAHFSRAVVGGAEVALGFTKRKNKNWFDENIVGIRELLKEKNKAHQAALGSPSSEYLRQQFRLKRAEARRTLRIMEDDWWNGVAAELRRYADSGDLQNFYASLKQVYGPTNRALTPVQSEDCATLLTSRNQILDRWHGHFSGLLNTHNPCDRSQLDSIADRPVVLEMDVLPSMQEISMAVQSLRNGKSPGVDGIPGEVLKHGGAVLHGRLYELISAIWAAESVPQQWKDAKIISIYKKKGERSHCGNSRGISILTIAGKVLAKVLLWRLNKHIVDEVCPETQCGFREERGTADMIFLARQLQEKCREQRRDLCLAFIDLSKAFDTVNREMLWCVMRKFGCPEKFIAITRAFHDGMKASVMVGGEETADFDVTVGVKQGCVVAPVLFNIYLAAVTMLFRQRFPAGHGVELNYRLDGSLFNLRRLQARTKVSRVEVCELQYADDCVLVTNSAEDLQNALSVMQDIYRALGLVINTTKTEVMYQWYGNGPRVDPPLNISGEDLSIVDQFNYLGSVLSADCSAEVEVNRRINKAAASFGRIQKQVILNHNLRLSTKVAVYRAVCLSVLLYGTETFTLYRKNLNLMESFHIRCIRRILGLSWQDRIPHSDILNRAGTTSIECMIHCRQLRWAGHVLRMPDSRLPKITLYGQLAEGTRLRGGPKKRYKDQLKKTLKNFLLRPDDLEVMVQDRTQWRTVCLEGAGSFEAERNRLREERRRRRHEGHNQLMDPELQCPDCGRQCGSRIGLYSHRQTHRPRQN